jgi:hypothetical protein
MLGALGGLSSLTGGGALTDSGGATSGGDNRFGGNAFDYRTNSGSGDGGGIDAATVAVGVISFIAGVIVCKAVS